jgi:hypothetical protein
MVKLNAPSAVVCKELLCVCTFLPVQGLNYSLVKDRFQNGDGEQAKQATESASQPDVPHTTLVLGKHNNSQDNIQQNPKHPNCQDHPNVIGKKRVNAME